MIEVIYGDIFQSKVDAIVNPANISLLKGGGLCGVIHKKSGAILEQQCKLLGKQEFGQAVITPSFNLNNCDYIIHACGSRWVHGNIQEKDLLAKTHSSIIQCALSNNLTSLAIPAISTGIYKFPVEVAAEIAIKAIKCACKQHNIDVTFVLSESEKYNIYNEYLHKSN